eukprot:CAMPEP_0184502280 /NCGR_PEP_ID=MMETSP0113_2-20130426/49879_1 /TAXON_ID=91329 /ORGANISM="Norrisiella sphaerica, Strain BC52" /LENGTH=70 /DNA_ID=CAMNT_0026891369 /DNA_START=169 /DNA_END=377 /DNA_ORIENTATION=+
MVPFGFSAAGGSLLGALVAFDASKSLKFVSGASEVLRECATRFPSMLGVGGMSSMSRSSSVGPPKKNPRR